MSQTIEQLLTRQLQQATDSFIKANLSEAWQQLQQQRMPQLQQLALSSDYAWRVLCQFPQIFWQFYQEGLLNKSLSRPYFHQQTSDLLALTLSDFSWIQRIRQYRQQ
ncbi:MAG: hypothetical protein KDI39_21625, partial [Pseudomonadales bacterium]|nr:hypothetical protein [Pseudomonadales bacterium]